MIVVEHCAVCMQDLTEEVANHQGDVDSTVDSGLELMKHISNDEAIQLKDKLDALQRRYNDLTARGADLLKNAQVRVMSTTIYDANCFMVFFFG